jgi:predicted metalloprotease with PDZ domain
LSVGDLLLAIDGERMTAGNWQDLLQRAPGDSVEIHFFRRGRLRSGRLPVHPPPADTCDLWLLEADGLDGVIRQRRDGWLGSSRKPQA